MVIEDTVNFLKDVPPFQFLSEQELKAVASTVATEFYPRDTVILRQDAPVSDALRVIRKGGVKISMRTGDGEEIIIDHRGEGDTFGLISLMGRDEKQKTTITAMEDTTCLLLKKDRIMPVIESNPAFTEYFLQFHFSKYIDKTYRELHAKSLFYGSSDHLLFTTPVGEMVTKAVVTAGPDATVQDAARIMAQNGISSIVIVDVNRNPVGIITDRDLREKVVAQGRSVSAPVKDIMTLPLIRADVKDHCSEALLKMIKNNVHHVLVVREGQLAGVLTNHDLMLLQGASPLSFARDIESQGTLEGLVPVATKINRMVQHLMKEGAKASNIAKIMAELNDRVVRKVLEIAERKYGQPPVEYCWITFGSNGRKEQTFRTDQDNAIIYADPATAELHEAAQRYFQPFTIFVRDSLVRCGFPPCREGYMASNQQWCQPLAVWKKYFFSWIAMPSPDAVQRSLICFDFRPLYGDHDLALHLRNYINFVLAGQNVFFAQVAAVSMKSRPPLGFFKTLIVEKDGEHKDKLNLWTSGIGPVVDVVRLMALDRHLAETSTLERIEALKGKLPLIDEVGDEIAMAFEFINLFRIHHQAAQVEHGQQPDNFIDPSGLSNLEKRMLKESFQVISRFQDGVLEHYRVGLIGA